MSKKTNSKKNATTTKAVKTTAVKATAKPAAKPVAKKVAKPVTEKTAKPIAKKAQAKTETIKKPVAKKEPEKKIKKTPTASKPIPKAKPEKPAKPLKPAKPAKPIKAELEKVKPVKPIKVKLEKAKPVKPEKPAKPAQPKIESALIVPGVKLVKVPFIFDLDKDEKRKRLAMQKNSDKATASSRPKIGNVLDTKNLIEFLSQQLEHENKVFFEGCGGQICVKCNANTVDTKFYVDKSLGYCTDCAMLLGLGQSKEGVFSDSQMELMRRSMEKSIESVGDIDEDDIENALLDDIDNLELEEALLAAVEESEFNV
jgi:hypothetical protein